MECGNKKCKLEEALFLILIDYYIDSFQKINIFDFFGD